MSYPNSDESEDQGKEADVSAQREIALRQILSPEARLRLNNVKMVKPDFAVMVENYLITLVSQGKINSQISDEQLKQILKSVQQPKRDFKINRL